MKRVPLVVAVDGEWGGDGRVVRVLLVGGADSSDARCLFPKNLPREACWREAWLSSFARCKLWPVRSRRWRFTLN